MTLDRPAVVGLVIGVAIGVVYIALQRAELRRKNAAIQPRGVWALVPGAVGRLVFLVAAWWLAFQFTVADKYWLTGGLVVAYSLPFFWQLKQMIFVKK
jgi:multisubunit Na+/H+ antiporter MnhB subunit